MNVLARRVGGVAKLKPVVRVCPRVIGGGVLKLERVQVICPACGQQVEAIATDGRVKGRCAVAHQYVDFIIKKPPVSIGKHFTAEHRVKSSTAHTGKHLTAEARAKISAAKKGKHLTAETKAKISAALRRYNKRG